MTIVANAAPATVRHHYEGGWYELVLRPPALLLAGQVIGSYCGWTESSTRLARRKELPSGIVPVILNLGRKIGVATPDTLPEPARYFGAFVAGLHDSYALTESSGDLMGVQVNLTPLAARRLFGLPMHELANRALELSELFGADATRLLDRLRAAPSWEARFTMLDVFLARRLAAASTRGTHAASPAVLWGWRRLQETGGRLAIGELVREVGFSHKHLIAQFREQLGFPPKTLARVLRFQHAMRSAERSALRLAEESGWAEIAQDCGYSDQAHLIRDFGELAGTTPTELLRERLASGAAAAAR